MGRNRGRRNVVDTVQQADEKRKDQRKDQRKANQRRRPGQKAKKRAKKLTNPLNAVNPQMNQAFAGPTTAAPQTFPALHPNEHDESHQSSASEANASDSEMAEGSEEEDADSDEEGSASGATDPEEEARLLREYIQRRNPGLIAEREHQLRQMRENRQIRNELLDLEDRDSGTDGPMRVRGEDAVYTGRQNSMSRVASSPTRERQTPPPPYTPRPSTMAELINAMAQDDPRPTRSLPSFRRAQPATHEETGEAYMGWVRDHGISNRTPRDVRTGAPTPLLRLRPNTINNIFNLPSQRVQVQTAGRSGPEVIDLTADDDDDEESGGVELA